MHNDTRFQGLCKKLIEQHAGAKEQQATAVPTAATRWAHIVRQLKKDQDINSLSALAHKLNALLPYQNTTKEN